MLTFAQKPKSNQKSVSPKLGMPDRAFSAHSPEVRSILRSQRTNGNRAVQRLPQADPEGEHAQDETEDLSVAPPIVHEVLAAPGQPLEVPTRAFIEPRLGHDFGRVRVHTGTQAAESARGMNALAHTVRQDMVFGAGHYAPGTEVGKRLLAHELAHIVQQSRVCQQIRSNVDSVVRRAPKNPLKGRRTREIIDTRFAPVIDNVLRQSNFLRPYIKDKLKTGRRITGKFEVINQKRFRHLYIKHEKSLGVEESEAKKKERNVGGFYDRVRDQILMPSGVARVGLALHEAIHSFAEPDFRKYFRDSVNEGVTQFYTNFVLAEFGLKDSRAYPDEYLKGLSLVFIVGREALGKAYFVPGYARKLFEALTHMFLKGRKREWLEGLGERDFVTLSGIPHLPLPKGWAIQIRVYRPQVFR